MPRRPWADYTERVPETPRPPASSLRAAQVAQTRAALVASARRWFGEQGYAATSVDDVAHDAGVTIGALYHHFATKSDLFEAVFLAVHTELMAASEQAATEATDVVELFVSGFRSFLDAVIEPEVQRILIVDAPAVLGLARFTELDERYAFAPIEAALKTASDSGLMRVHDPATLTRLLLGALTRGALLIASSADPPATRDAVAQTIGDLLAGLAPGPSKSRTRRQRPD